MAKEDDNAKNILKIAADVFKEKKGEDIVSLHISPLSTICDDFLIVSGASTPHVIALQDAVEDALGRAGYMARIREGNPEGGWVLLDYLDVVIHIFSREMRDFYDLEHTWRDAECTRY